MKNRKVCEVMKILVACVNTNRNFIGIELSEEYYNIAKERIENVSNSK